ncbi:MAG: tetratricopeptide repeat protein [Magnetococcales bacterium]|nr:tetratricopeptide repeat protein [Magnetococcales bacterium]
MDKHNSQKGDGRSQLTVDEAYKKAIEYLDAGSFTKAEQLCTAILQTNPEHIDAINCLGIIAQKLNRHDLAIQQFQKTINISKNIALLYYNLATSLYQLELIKDAEKVLSIALQIEPENRQITDLLNKISNVKKAKSTSQDTDSNEKKILQKAINLHIAGDYKSAIQCYQKALELNPENTIALSNIGTAFQHTGQIDKAVTSYEKALSIKPDFVEVYSNLGTVLQEQGKFTQAAASYQKAIAIKPDFADAYSNLGNTMREIGNLEEAEQYCQKALLLKPNFADAHSNLGNIFFAQDRLEEAVSSYKKAISIKPDFVDAHSNLANILTKQGKLDEAILSYQHAIALNPDFADAYSNLSHVMWKIGNLDEAEKNCQKAISLKPNFANTHSILGNIFFEQNRLEKAVTSYKKAISLNPDFIEAHSNLAHILVSQGKVDEAITSYKKATSIKPYNADIHSYYIFKSDLFSQKYSELYQIERKVWADRHTKHLQALWPKHNNSPDTNRKIKIGYVGAEFYFNPNAEIFGPVLLNHDKNKFQIYSYAGNKNEDELTLRFQEVSDHWLKTENMDDVTLAKKIYQDGIDILIDLNGHSPGDRLLTFARKPAPIQITAWGYPFGTKMSAMDYLFADPYSIPYAERYSYIEKIIDLPCGFHMSSETIFPEVTEPPVIKNGYITFGSFNRLENAMKLFMPCGLKFYTNFQQQNYFSKQLT